MIKMMLNMKVIISPKKKQSEAEDEERNQEKSDQEIETISTRSGRQVKSGNTRQER